MSAFRMNASLMTGHTQIDAEHEHILILFNQFVETVKVDDGKRSAEKIAELTKALENHLENEEKILEEHGYPDLEGHKEHHREAKKRYLARIEKAGLEGYGGGFSDDLIAILSDDLIAADLDFKTYLQKMAYKG